MLLSLFDFQSLLFRNRWPACFSLAAIADVAVRCGVITKVLQDRFLTTCPAIRKSNHLIELFIVRFLSRGQMIVIDLKLRERNISFSKMDRSSTKGGNVFKSWQTAKLSQMP